MGIDAHLFVERKVDGNWTYVPEASKDNLSDDRDVVLDSLLEGYRLNRRVPVLAFEERIPADVSAEVLAEAESWGNDDCVFGYAHITLRALKEYDWRRLRDNDPRCNGKLHWFATEAIPKLEALGLPDDVRIVYWFDR